MKINRELSLQTAKQVPRARDKDCYRNAVHATSVLGAGSLYVEGWVVCVSGGIPLPTEHGWVEYEGSVIDVTPIFLEEGSEYEYFPGVRYDFQMLWERISKPGTTLPLVGLASLSNEPHREAYFEANRAAFGEDGVRLLQDTFDHNQRVLGLSSDSET